MLKIVIQTIDKTSLGSNSCLNQTASNGSPSPQTRLLQLAIQGIRDRITLNYDQASSNGNPSPRPDWL